MGVCIHTNRMVFILFVLLMGKNGLSRKSIARLLWETQQSFPSLPQLFTRELSTVQGVDQAVPASAFTCLITRTWPQEEASGRQHEPVREPVPSIGKE